MGSPSQRSPQPRKPRNPRNNRNFRRSRRSRPNKAYMKRQQIMQKAAHERVADLFHQAHTIHSSDPELANRYVTLARKIAMGTKITIPRKLKRSVCHGCKNLLVTGATMRSRLHSRRHYGLYRSVTCLSCGHITRYILVGRAKRTSEGET